MGFKIFISYSSRDRGDALLECGCAMPPTLPERGCVAVGA